MNDPTMLLKTAEEIAREAGGVLMGYFGKVRQITYKGIGDIVTEADKASEKLITERLHSEFPDHAVYGEEFGMSAVKSDNCWVTDPLDGTTNYAASFPIFAIAIALLHKGIPMLGVVFDPNTNRMFSAAKDCGATLNGVPLHVNNRETFDAIGVFGFSAEVITSLNRFVQKPVKGRSLGSAALHICSVAAGYFDGSFDSNTRLWDIAAPAVILEEAGGVMTHPSGESCFPLPPDAPAYRGERMPFLATNGKIHEECVEALRSNNRTV